MKARSIAALSMLAGFALGAAAIQSIHAQTKPQPVTYYIAEVEVTNLDGYLKDYVPRMETNVKAFGGRILAETTRVATIEGDPPQPRVVLQFWNDIEKFQAWRNAPESREIRAIGHKYAKFRSFIVEGYPP
jgi:uncharacterized protein (DUF1330 family)